MAELRLSLFSSNSELERGKREIRDFLVQTISPELRNTLSIALEELVRNAYEHGNLGITSEEKRMLLENGEFEREVARRQSYCETKRILVEIEASPETVRATVEDDGVGFDRESSVKTPEVEAVHGRGLEIAERVFDSLRFELNGTRVVAEKRLL